MEETRSSSISGRNFGQPFEVQLHLDIFKEQNIIKLFDGKKYKKQDVYKKIHQEMAKNGVASKTVEQIKNK
jgi:hypothetical protein